MTTSDGTRDSLLQGLISRLDRLPLERARLALYLICLGISFLLYLLVHGSGAGTLFWLLAAAAIAGTVYGAMTDMARNGAIGAVFEAAFGPGAKPSDLVRALWMLNSVPE